MTTNHRDKAEGHLEAARAMLEIEPDPEHPTMILATTLCRLEAALATVDALERIAARLTGLNHPAAACQHDTTAATSPRLARELLEERYPTPPGVVTRPAPAGRRALKAAW